MREGGREGRERERSCSHAYIVRELYIDLVMLQMAKRDFKSRWIMNVQVPRETSRVILHSCSLFLIGEQARKYHLPCNSHERQIIRQVCANMSYS